MPLTERILAWIGGRWIVWAALWAILAVVRPVIFAISVSVSRRAVATSEWNDILVSQAVIAYVTFIGLSGVRRIWHGALALAPDLASLARDERAPEFFPGMGSTLGPLALLAIVAVASFVSEWLRWGPLSALADLPLMLINTLAIMAFVWTYLVLLAGLHRLGQARLSLEPFPEDRSLGLGPVGSLALMGFWLVLAAAIPLILVSLENLATVALSLAAVAASVALFFLSMVRIHRQMAETKARHVATARSLYREAYQPVRTKPSLKALQAQAPSLGVAQALVERAERVQVWPIDERATAWVAVVVTGVVTSLIVRLVLAAAGI